MPPLRFPRISVPHRIGSHGLRSERRDRSPRHEFTKVAWRRIENAPRERKHGYFPAVGAATRHELQFKLLRFRAFADQSLHERGEMSKEQQHFEAWPAHERAVSRPRPTRAFLVSRNDCSMRMRWA